MKSEEDVLNTTLWRISKFMTAEEKKIVDGFWSIKKESLMVLIFLFQRGPN